MAKESSYDLLQRFFAHCNCHATTVQIFIGIDTGAKGAIGFIWDKWATVVDIPTYKVKRNKRKQTEYDLDKILALFDLLPLMQDVYAIIEKPAITFGGGRGQANQFASVKMGQGFGMWPLFLRSKGITTETKLPHEWKKAMGLNSNKGRSLSIARSMFPKAPLSHKKDDGRAEALLLTAYLRSLWNAQKIGAKELAESQGLLD